MLALGGIVAIGLLPSVAFAQEAPKAETGSTFWWFIETSGLIGALILVLSIYFVSTVGRLFVELRQKVAAPPEIVDQVEEMLGRRALKEIFTLVKEDNSHFSRLLTAGITELPNGIADAREAMERTNEAITVNMEKKISMLAVLGTLGPMIGLLGTLKGMIGAFGEIARSGNQIDPGKVATNISEALLLTFEGVALSVPSIYFYAVFRNRVASISAATLLQADEVLRHFAHAAKAKPAAPAQGAAPAVPKAPAKT